MIIFGRQAVLEALRAGTEISKIYFLYGSHGKIIGDIHQEARNRKIPLVELPQQKFDRLGNVSHAQGCAALVEEVRHIDVNDLLRKSDATNAVLLLALDEIEDPHNLGALLRTAHCAGIQAVILPKHQSAPITDTVVKASAGATNYIPIAKVSNLPQTLKALKEQNIWIIGLDGEGTVDLFDFQADRNLCLVVGSEGKGLRPTVKKVCDEIVRIPMEGKISSLNASVAGALMMYEVLRKQRRQA